MRDFPGVRVAERLSKAAGSAKRRPARASQRLAGSGGVRYNPQHSQTGIQAGQAPHRPIEGAPGVKQKNGSYNQLAAVLCFLLGPPPFAYEDVKSR